MNPFASYLNQHRLIVIFAARWRERRELTFRDPAASVSK
jgi:hypothetical protein